MRRTTDPRASTLPRLWASRSTPLVVGETLRRSNGLLAAAAAAAAKPGTVSGGVRVVTVSDGSVTLVTPSSFQIRLGDVGDLGLKLAIARRIVSYAGASIANDVYVDVSVPQRPVLGSKNSQLGSTG
jgi:hypothetical protein